MRWNGTGPSSRNFGKAVFEKNRPGYLELSVEEIRPSRTAIHGHREFVSFIEDMEAHFIKWRERERRETQGN